MRKPEPQDLFSDILKMTKYTTKCYHKRHDFATLKVQLH